MKYPENIQDTVQLQPDYLGFIFFDKSPRFFNGEMPILPLKTKKVGVFVNAYLDDVLDKVRRYNLQIIQLHGNEKPIFCKALKQADIKVIKVFSVDDDFDFEIVHQYENVCDYFLFDTKGKHYGGNGMAFNWQILEKYTSQKPYFLSGGIGFEEIPQLKDFLATTAGKLCYSIDVNSKFETQPGLKNTQLLKEFKNELSR